MSGFVITHVALRNTANSVGNVTRHPISGCTAAKRAPRKVSSVWLVGWVVCVCETGNETCNRGCIPPPPLPPRRDTTRPHICGIDYYLGREHKWLSPPLLSTHAQRAGSNYTAASDCLRRRRRTHWTCNPLLVWGCALKAPLPPPPRLPDCRWIGVFACSINGNLALCAGSVIPFRARADHYHWN